MKKIHYIVITVVALIIAVCAIFLAQNKNKDNSVKTAVITEQSDETASEGENMASYKSITMDEAKEIFKTEGDYIILDVRRADEYASGHIPGAINYANEDISDSPIDVLPDMSQTIYVYCRSGRRSKEASSKLAAIGYTNIIEFGGIIDWTGDIEQ